MLNYLLERSPRASGQKTRQMTLDAMFSRVKNPDTPKQSSSPPSLTTASSATDRSSEPSEDIPGSSMTEATLTSLNGAIGNLKEKMRSSLEQPQESEGPKDLSISTTTTTNETDEMQDVVMSDSSESSLSSPEPQTPKASTPLPMTQPNEPHDRFVRESLEVLYNDFEATSLPGDKLATSQERDQSRQTTPRRTQVAQRASQILKDTKTVLGKRKNRDTSEPVMKSKECRESPRRSNLRQRTVEDSVPKKARVSFDKCDRMGSEPSGTTLQMSNAKKQQKQWVDKGFFVGQDRSFDPRLTGAKNHAKAKLQSQAGENKKTNKILPPPSFISERIINKGRDFKLPWNVFAPILGKVDKPKDWRRLQRNVFVGDTKDVWTKKIRPELSLCLCSKEAGCGETCLNRTMNYECNENNCAAGPESCTNRPFADLKARLAKSRSLNGALYKTGVEVLPTHDRGFGLRSNRTFDRNQIIVEYTGEIVTREEAERRVRNDDESKKCFYQMHFEQNMILDGTRGSIARFVNHSCEPNCTIQKWTVDGKPRVALFAGDKGITTGEELTYDYNFSPYDDKNLQECHCGATKCRGYLKAKSKETKELKDALNPIANGNGKRKLGEVAGEAYEGAKDFVKRRKINSLKGVKAMLGKNKADTPSPKNSKKKESAEKPLPTGWVYPKEAQPHRSINEVDPEKIIKDMKAKKAKEKKDKEKRKQKRQQKKQLATVSEGSEEEEEQFPQTRTSPRQASTSKEPNIDGGKQSPTRAKVKQQEGMPDIPFLRAIKDFAQEFTQTTL